MEDLVSSVGCRGRSATDTSKSSSTAVAKRSQGPRSHNMPGLFVALSSAQVTPLHGLPVLSPSDGEIYVGRRSLLAWVGSGGQLCWRREGREDGRGEGRRGKDRSKGEIKVSVTEGHERERVEEREKGKRCQQGQMRRREERKERETHRRGEKCRRGRGEEIRSRKNE